MTFDEAKAILSDAIGWPGKEDLYSYPKAIIWKSGEQFIELRGEFGMDELKAIVVYVKHVQARPKKLPYPKQRHAIYARIYFPRILSDPAEYRMVNLDSKNHVAWITELGKLYAACEMELPSFFMP